MGWQGSDRNVARTNTMSRFETETLTQEDNLKGLALMNPQWVELAMAHTPHRRVILDMASSECPVHGQQEGAAYNGHFECVCYHPLFLFNQFGDCEGATLRITSGFPMTETASRISWGAPGPTTPWWTTTWARPSTFGSFTDDRGHMETLVSSFPVAVVAPSTPATGAPTITGTAQVGETLTVETSAIDDADGLDNVSYSYQWLANDAEIAGATDPTYTLVDDDAGKTIKVKVSFRDDKNNRETLTSEATTTYSRVVTILSQEKLGRHFPADKKPGATHTIRA